MKKRYPKWLTRIGFVAVTALTVWAAVDLADGSITRRRSVETFPSFVYLINLILVGVVGALLIATWIKILRRARSDRDDGDWPSR